MKRASWLMLVAVAASASDHDDGETDTKTRAVDLADHFAFTSPENPEELVLAMHVNPRSLPGRGYFLASDARYEFHVSRAGARPTPPTLASDFVFRIEAAPPDRAGVQALTLTVLEGGAIVGTHTGASTGYEASQRGAITENTAAVAGVRYFVGQRADPFHFDINRFFQVRAFLVERFFGGVGGAANPSATLALTCDGDAFLAGGSDGDAVNLWNPPACAPDFARNLNVTAIVLTVPRPVFGATVLDTWATIAVPQ